MKIIIILWTLFFVCFPTSAQVVERPYPEEWKQLVPGARFVDRFLPMPDGRQETGIWGADSVLCRYVDNGIELPDVSFWGGNILRSSDGKYHLYVCGWAEDSPNGHGTWWDSTVFHAECDNSTGPFKIRNTVGRGHNPEAFRLDDGRIVVYVIDGYYIADCENSLVWMYKKFNFDARDRNIIDGLSNLTFARRSDGSRLMVCRGGGVWVSRDGQSTYRQLTSRSVYPAIEGHFEDPVVWRDSLQYHLIVNDWKGRIAYYLRSKDGVHWFTEPGEAYVPGVSFHRDGTRELWFKYERPKVFQDEWGRVTQMNFAVIDTLKWEDKPCDRHSSKNISIPLNKGLLLEVLNEKEITSSTKNIELRIIAEQGFDPHKEVDVQSLRFGSYQEVNYGRGSKPVRTRKDGKDLIVVFNDKGSGITAEEFAPKLIGRKRNGEMVFGYARLPYVDYCPALVSACKPVYVKDEGRLDVRVENFGLSVSSPAELEIWLDGVSLGRQPISPIKPYDSIMVSQQVGEQHVTDTSVWRVTLRRVNGEILEDVSF